MVSLENKTMEAGPGTKARVKSACEEMGRYWIKRT
jgi:hypothetical protein